MGIVDINNFSEKQRKDFICIFHDLIVSVSGFADKYNLDRDEMFTYIGKRMEDLSENISIKTYE